VHLPEYDSLDATALAALVARGQVTASELLEAALERADLRNPPVNAITARYDDEARRRAAGPLPKGPFTGVPFVIKDLMTAWKGHPMSAGSRLQAGFVPDYDSEVVKRLEGAGLVVFGTTNAPEFGILAHTEPVLHGPARNPWNPAHTPGGSSGGSAAAVAARIVPAAHGNDGGGSIRIPASDCGLFGLKPTRGRISFAPGAGEAWMGLVSEGVLTRSVRDSAALLDVLASHVSGDPYSSPARAGSFAAEVGAPPGRLRVAWTDRSLFGHGTDPECSAAVRDAARLLSDLGHEVEEAAPPLRRDELVLAYLHVVAASTAADVEVAARRTGRRPGAAVLEETTLALAAAGNALSSADLVASIEIIHAAARDLGGFFDRYDVLVTPTVAQPPPLVGALQPRTWERFALRLAAATRSRTLIDRLFAQVGDRSFDATGFTMPFNQTGQPAMSVPLHVSASGLPIGVQVVGRFGDEATLFRLASQLEAARPWTDRMPPGVASGR
jgi:amidase